MSTDAVDPDGASDVGGSLGIGLFAFAIDDLVAFIALFTNAFFKVELLALSLDLAAGAVLIEIVVLRTLDAGVTLPDSAAKVVIKLFDESGIVELSCGELYLLCG